MSHMNMTYRIITMTAVLFLLAGCQSQKPIQIPMPLPYVLGVNQKAATNNQPSQFYVCGNREYPCQSVTDRWSGKKVKSFKKIRKQTNSKKHRKYQAILSIKKAQEKENEKSSVNNICVAS